MQQHTHTVLKFRLDSMVQFSGFVDHIVVLLCVNLLLWCVGPPSDSRALYWIAHVRRTPTHFHKRT